MRVIPGGIEESFVLTWKRGKPMPNEYTGLTARQVWEIKDRAIRGDKIDDIVKDYGISRATIMQMTVDQREKYDTVTDEAVLGIVDDYEDNGMSLGELADKYHTKQATIRWVLWDRDYTSNVPPKVKKTFDDWFRNEWKAVVGHE